MNTSLRRAAAIGVAADCVISVWNLVGMCTHIQYDAWNLGRTVAFLASDGSGFMTGSTLTMNGAQYIT